MRRWFAASFIHGYYQKLLKVFDIYKDDLFKDVEVWYPMRDEVVVKKQKRIVKKVPLFPGYILFKFDERSEIWKEITRKTPIFSFIRDQSGMPIPLTPKEVKSILCLEEYKIYIDYKYLYRKNVLITKGPYANFIGKCRVLVIGKNIAKVNINLFEDIEREVEISVENLEVIS